MGKQRKQWQALFSWAPKSLQMMTSAMKLKDSCSLEEKLWQRRRIDTFELWCWGRLSRVSWTARRSNQSIIKEINLEYSLEGMKLQYFGHVLQTAVSLSSVQSLCHVRPCDPMNHSTPGLPVHHQLPEFTQTHVQRVSDAIQPSHPLSSLSPPAPIPPSIRVFSNESVLHIRWPKYWSLASASVLPMNI